MARAFPIGVWRQGISWLSRHSVWPYLFIYMVTTALLGMVRGWRLTSAGWFDKPVTQAARGKMRFEDFLPGFLGLLTSTAIPFLWWALINMYAGR